MTKIIQETASMLTRDGIRLDADIYRPETSEKLPILLMRQPYGKAIASTVVYAHPRWYASQGYIVVIQDVRGRGTSNGNFELFANEVNDGIDTIDWVSQLPESTGEVGMYGFSYQGMTQLYAAIGKSSALKAIAPAMVGYDLYSDWAYENGAFCLQANLGWAIQLAAETARLQGDDTAYQKLYRASRNLPLSDKIPAQPDILQELAADSFYHQWLTHELPGEYWQNLSPKYLIQDVDLPMLHIGGWFDPYLRGTLHLYRDMAARSKYPQHLIVAPWAHLPWGSKLGMVDYGIEAQNYIDEIQIRWFDHWLKGKDTGLLAEDPVSLFEMGSNQWRYFDKFPENQEKIYYLASDGLAGMICDRGMLWEFEAEESENTFASQDLLLTEATETTEFVNTTDILVHDPWRPVPALGGHASFPGGSCDRSMLDCRSDILTYTSATLEEDLHIVGEVTVELYCEADHPSFDLSVVLSEVYPDGKVLNFTQGYLRMNEQRGSKTSITIPLQATCMKVSQGHALRLSISAACFPAYLVNPGTGQSLLETRLIDAQIITISLHSGESYPSKIILNYYDFN
ncbi:CocE/NonD family hydrolase [Xenococcus sp. PCC 7305]|uniref:CocE/NonD family hydrolase n=1 Tax=Xenococcus sp. PCC 7305 TaxID=102125 RepID=UPI0005929B09|nr:CocE/NonD family hydrolase [Xenococcus sp. PCC 7305]